MSLRAVHDFELQLLDPCLAMTERGLPVCERTRQDMLLALDAELGPLRAQVDRTALAALRSAKKLPRRSLFLPKLKKSDLVRLAMAEGLPESSANGTSESEVSGARDPR